MKKILLGAIFTLFLALNFQATAWAQSAWKPRGVLDKTQSAMILDKDLHQGIDKVNKVISIGKPGSTSFTSCFSQAAELKGKASGELFSNDYSKQVAVPLNEGMDAIKEAFSFDTLVNYDAKVTATIGVTGSFSVSPSEGNNENDQTVKGLECEEKNKVWDASRSKTVKPVPSFSNIVARNFGDEIDEGWEQGTDSLSESINERATLTNRETRKILLFEGPDIPFNSRADFCAVLNFIGIEGDCEADEMNRRPQR